MLLITASVAAIAPELVRSASAVPPHVAAQFKDPWAFQPSTSGHCFVSLKASMRSAFPGASATTKVPPAATENAVGWMIRATAGPICTIGHEPARGRGSRSDHLVLNGIGSLQYTGASILISQPETGGLITEYSISGHTSRTFGDLRATGHEDDRDLHLALNSGIPLVDPRGGFYFVFQAGIPVFRKFDATGRLLFERRMQGLEIDQMVAMLPATWPRRDDELPVVMPTVRTAAVDSNGNLWVSYAVPYTYVYDSDGDKVRTVQFYGAGIVSPASLFFGPKGRLLVTPGLYEFEVAGGAGRTGGAGAAGGAGKAVR